MDKHEWLSAVLKPYFGSQAELARTLGLSRQAVSKWFRSDPLERSEPDDEHLRRIADIIKVPVGKAPEVVVSEAPGRYTHGRSEALLKETRALVRSFNPVLAQYWHVPVSVPGSRPLRVEYVSPRLALALADGRRQDTAWSLAVLAAMDRRLGVKRAVVCAVTSRLVPSAIEMELLGVQRVDVQSAQQLAEIILETG